MAPGKGTGHCFPLLASGMELRGAEVRSDEQYLGVERSLQRA